MKQQNRNLKRKITQNLWYENKTTQQENKRKWLDSSSCMGSLGPAPKCIPQVFALLWSPSSLHNSSWQFALKIESLTTPPLRRGVSYKVAKNSEVAESQNRTRANKVAWE